MEKLESYLIKLKQKFNYSSELMNLLTKVIKSLININGIEKTKLIFDALYNCEIIFREKNENEKENAAASYNKEIIIEQGIIKESHKIYVYKSNLENEQIITNLVHEICHLIKGYNQLYINGNNVLSKCGLIKMYYKINGNLIEFVNYENIELEEAINCYDTSLVLSDMYGFETSDDSYYSMFISIKPLITNNSILKFIRKSQFNNDDCFFELLGKDNYKLLTDNLKNIDYFTQLKVVNDLDINNLESSKLILLQAILDGQQAISENQKFSEQFEKSFQKKISRKYT